MQVRCTQNFFLIVTHTVIKQIFDKIKTKKYLFPYFQRVITNLFMTIYIIKSQQQFFLIDSN